MTPDAPALGRYRKWTPDPGASIKELFRALRVGGLLVATIGASQVVPLNQLWNDVMQVVGVTLPTGIGSDLDETCLTRR